MYDLISEEEKAKIVEKLRENRYNIEKTANQMMCSQKLVEWVDVVENKRYNYTPEGRGRKDLQQYIIDIIQVGKSWDNSKKKINQARKDYNDGKIEMCTARDGMNLILYAIPRNQRIINRKDYFDVST